MSGLLQQRGPMNKIDLGKGMLLAIVVASSIGVLGAQDKLSLQSSPSTAPAAQVPAQPAKTTAVRQPVRVVPNRTPDREIMYYAGIWGIDSLRVKYTESGEMIRFSYRVVDPSKAAPLNDKKAEPFLYDPQAGVKLVVPQMEKVGQLRQSSTPKAGMQYWMAFSNSGRRVRPGHRVSIEIGQFHAANLAVE
jgi:hypothetical protein